MDWTIPDAVLSANNLGGLGPNLADAEEIRISGVAQHGGDIIDLRVTVDPSGDDYAGESYLKAT